MFTDNHIELETIESTNAYILDLQDRNLFKEGLVVVAKHQTAGSGQRGNSWESNKDENLLLSVVIEPSISVNQQFEISKLVALSICDTLYKLGLAPQIKWPNDILISKQKIAGLLIHNKFNKNIITHSIIGIGLNINQIMFNNYSPKATSLNLLLGKKFDINQIKNYILQSLSNRIECFRIGKSNQKDYLELLYLKDTKALFESNNHSFQGVILGVDQQGALLIECEDNTVEVFRHQEVKFVF